jgi:hypothetical protein
MTYDSSLSTVLNRGYTPYLLIAQFSSSISGVMTNTVIISCQSPCGDQLSLPHISVDNAMLLFLLFRYLATSSGWSCPEVIPI